MKVYARGERVEAGTREDQELVCVLGGVGLLREDEKSLIQISLLTQGLNQWVVVAATAIVSGAGGRAQCEAAYRLSRNRSRVLEGF